MVMGRPVLPKEIDISTQLSDLETSVRVKPAASTPEDVGYR